MCGTARWEWEADPNAWHADHAYCEGCRRKAEHRKNVMLTPSATEHAGLEVRLYKLPRDAEED